MSAALPPLERLLCKILRAGTFVSGALLAAGLVAAFVYPRHPLTKALLAMGLAVLLLTPVVRVIVSFVDFLWTKDWWFALSTAIVLALLAGGFIAAFRL
jgi:uncharacterized membrane protein